MESETSIAVNEEVRRAMEANSWSQLRRQALEDGETDNRKVLTRLWVRSPLLRAFQSGGDRKARELLWAAAEKAGLNPARLLAEAVEEKIFRSCCKPGRAPDPGAAAERADRLFRYQCLQKARKAMKAKDPSRRLEQALEAIRKETWREYQKWSPTTTESAFNEGAWLLERSSRWDYVSIAAFNEDCPPEFRIQTGSSTEILKRLVQRPRQTFSLDELDGPAGTAAALREAVAKNKGRAIIAEFLRCVTALVDEYFGGEGRE